MLNEQQRIEREPVAIQQELMAIDAEMERIQPLIEQKMEEVLTAKVALDGLKSKSQHLKGRAMILQGVLKSLK